MTKQKTGWANVEKLDGKHKEPVAQKKATSPKGKKIVPKSKKEKVYEAPYGFLVGTTNGEKYVFDRDAFNDTNTVIAAVRKALTKTHEDGLREVVIHLRKQKPSA